jgi:hypothetical protein
MARKRSDWIVDLSGVPRYCDIEELTQVSVPVFDQVTQKRTKMKMGTLFQKFR